jgi:ATP-binding protein involved in chromosome partitioning
MNQEQALAILKNVKVPAQRENIVDANQIRRLEIKEKSVFVEIGLAELSPTFEKSLRYQIEKAFKDQDPSLEVAVEFAQATKTPEKKRPQIGTMIAIGSGKGGVGKSSVTMNLAFALKKLGYKVGILDCDLYGPSIPTLMGVEGLKPFVLDGRIQPIDADGIHLMSAGFFVEEGQGLIWRGPMIHKLIHQFYWDVNWDGTDVLLVDLPPGTGDAPLSLSQTMPLTGAVMVSLPQKLSLIDVHKAFAMFAQVKVPVLGIVENMAEFICPQCNHPSEIFSRGGVRTLCEQLGTPFLGEIPLDPRVRDLCDRGKSIVKEAPDSLVAKAFMSLAERLAPMLKTSEEAQEPIKIVM